MPEFLRAIRYSIRKEAQWRSWAEIYEVIWEIPDKYYQAGLDMCPKIRFSNGILYSRSNIILSLLTLFLFFKRITVCPSERTITIHRRLFWLLSRVREIPFDAVEEVNYDHRGVEHHGGEGGSSETSYFTVSLRLHSGERVKLWTFSGQGGWYASIFIGTQADYSGYFVDLLKFLLEKPVDSNN